VANQRITPPQIVPSDGEKHLYHSGNHLQFEYAKLSLIGDREENQDRVLVMVGDDAALLIVLDGMGGHADGARAAEVACETIAEAFRVSQTPILDPQGFLHKSIGRAHAHLVSLGAELSIESRPRATCAICLVQDGLAFWAHVGDSRIYIVRNGQALERTRDHSHVELLLQEGVISEEELADHPMKNFVECCLGGDAALPGMSVTTGKKLRPGDILLACTDGLWSGVNDEELAQLEANHGRLADGLLELGEQAVRACMPYADNTSAVALRWDA
jgi:serine/threonine protein phosphatase PrpC